MHDFGKRIAGHGLKVRFSVLFIPIFFLFAGIMTAFFLRKEAFEVFFHRLNDAGIGLVFTAQTGCVFLFFTLLISAFFIAAPVLTAVLNIVYGFFISTVWGFIIATFGGDISFFNISAAFAAIFILTTAFVVFSQTELVFYSSVFGHIRRDKSFIPKLRRLLLIALFIAMLLFAVLRILGSFAPSV